MEKIPTEFLEDAIRNLSELLDELRQITESAHASLPQAFSQKLFRTLHTIKGSAQTFGLETEAQTAHEIESFLSALRGGSVLWNTDSETLLKNSLEILVENMRSVSAGGNVNSTAELIAELRRFSGKVDSSERELPANFPKEVADKLSAAETKVLCSEWSLNKEILILEFAFAQQDFGAKFKQARAVLESAGQVIAVASQFAQTPENKAVFRFLTVAENSSDLAGVLRELNGRVLFQRQNGQETAREKFSSNDHGEDAIGQAIRHGETAAAILGKKVKFETSDTPTQIPAKLSQSVATILLHVVRNAVDHGIEFPLERAAFGKPAVAIVKISAREVAGELRIEVSDDGRGVEQPANVFAEGYSTAPFMTELSGRGVGLDVVADVVRQANGIIKIESKPGLGAKFEIDLPVPEK